MGGVKNMGSKKQKQLEEMLRHANAIRDDETVLDAVAGQLGLDEKEAKHVLGCDSLSKFLQEQGYSLNDLQTLIKSAKGGQPTKPTMKIGRAHV